MEGNKLDLTSKPTPVADSAATYKAIPEVDTEEDAVTRPKSLVKLKPDSPETDGADEKMLPKEDTVVELKLSPNEKQNGDAKLDIGDLKTAFVGLTKEELMKYANDPFWVRLRWFLFITFWILWGVMLLGAILIICAAPKCDPPPPKTWWEKGPLVELEREIEIEELTRIKENGVTGVIVSWTEETYASIDETHNFVKSLKKYKDADIKVIIDLEPGTSNVWFNKSESRDSLYSDYYIWKPSKTTIDTNKPPNNWVTIQNQSSWKYSKNRKEFYYCPEGSSPHLNFRNPNVTEAFSNIIKKFISFGANGIRLRGVPLLLVDPTFEDEVPKSNAADFDLHDYGFYAHTKTENHLDLAPLLQQWNVIVKNLTENGPLMVAEDLNNIEAYRVNNSYVVDLPSQSHLFSKRNSTVADLINVLTATFRSDNITWPLWNLHSSSDVIDIVTYLLPGTPLIKLNSTVDKDLLKIRDSPSIMRGTFEFHSVNNGSVLAFIRVTPGNPGILVALNPTLNHTVVNFPEAIPVVSAEVTVQLLSKNYNESDIQVNVKHKADNIPISPQSALVLSYVPIKLN